jgi:hypothetical protein
MNWEDIQPADAVDLNLASPTAWVRHIRAPRNEIGEPCPWPWEPQQLKGVPLGQYRCSYCLGMNVAGVPHLNWRPEDIKEMEDHNYGTT